jgi:hypothetical protein
MIPPGEGPSPVWLCADHSEPPHHSARVGTTPQQIDLLFVHFMDQVLTSHILGTRKNDSHKKEMNL